MPDPVNDEQHKPAAVEEDVAAKDVAVKDAAVDDVGIKDVAVKDVAAKDLAAKDVTAKDVPVEDVTVEDVTVEDVTVEDSGVLAAEYVLGSLNAEERARATDMLAGDPGFRDMVRLWERRLGELHLMVEPVEPPSDIWGRIKEKTETAVQIPAQPLSETLPNVVPPAEQELTLDALEAELVMAGLHPGGAPELPLDTAGAKTAAPETAAPVLPPAAQPRERAIPDDRQDPDDSDRALRRWRLAAILMALAAMALGSVVAAWRYAPDRLPSQLQPAQFLKLPKPPPPSARRPPAPPESQFDE
jgi:anti-sigma-K factor RskA